MKGNGKRLMCLALAGLLCWAVPAQALPVAALQEDAELAAADDMVTGADLVLNGGGQ